MPLLLVNLAAPQMPAVQPSTNAVVTKNTENSYFRVPLHEPGDNSQRDSARTFWPVTLKEWVGLIQGFAVIAAAWVGFLGINAWRKEFLGRRKIELAEEGLALFYQAKSVIEFMRSPAGYAGEGSTRKRESKETPEQQKTRDDAYVIYERYNMHAAVFGRIFTLRYRFIAQFGKDADAPFAGLKSVCDELFVAARGWSRLSEVDEGAFTNRDSMEEHRSSIEKKERIMWGVTDSDPIQARLDTIIRQIEGICEPHLKPLECKGKPTPG
jgi:hypothetical protein